MLINIFTISLVQLLGAASPGPDFAVVTANSLSYTRKIGIYTALGVALGIMVHTSYCVLGFSAFLIHNPFLLQCLKYLGGSYLAYLGIKALFAKSSDPKNSELKSTIAPTPFQALKDGLLCNLLNPKAILFFISLFTLIIKSFSSTAIEISLSVEFIINTFVWFSLVAILFTHPKIQKIIHKVQHIIIKTLGIVLVLIGFTFIFSH